MTLFAGRAGSGSPRGWQFWTVLALAAALTGWQLFVPPIVGLADQGDFGRIVGPLGYAPQPKGPEHKYSYLTRTYVWDPTYREPRWEQLSSEFLLVPIALALNRVFANPATFDLTIVGLVHWLLFLAAFARLLFVTRTLPHYRVVWAAMLLILTDVGYTAYWNSLYTEPASCLFFLFLLAETIGLSTGGPATVLAVLRWDLLAVLWVTAKTQNASLCLLLVPYGLTLAWRAGHGKARYAALVGAAAILAAGVTMYRSLLPAPKLVSVYDTIFMAILPESPDPAADLRALGLDPGYVRYSGTLPWSPGTGVADGSVVNAIQANVTPARLVLFYLKRPVRLWRHVRGVLRVAFSLRPEFCGNFDRSAGRPPDARSNAVALWSYLHERWLSRVGLSLLIAILLAPLGCILLLCRRGLTAVRRRLVEIALGLCLCCSIAFFTVALGDAYDTVKHMFLFNLLLDTCLVFGLVAAVEAVTGRSRRSRANDSNAG